MRLQGGYKQIDGVGNHSTRTAPMGSGFQTISDQGNPYLRNTNEILHALGFHLSVAPNELNHQKRA